MAKISEIFVKIGADTKELSAALKNTKEQINNTFQKVDVNSFQDALSGLGTTIEGVANKFSALSSAAALAGGFGLAQVKGLAASASQLHDLADAYEISYDKISGFKRAVEWSGGSVDELASSILRLDKKLQSDSEEALRAKAVIEALGVSLYKADGSFKSVDEQLYALKDGLLQAKSAGLQQEAVLAVLGSRGASLIPVINQLNDNLRDNNQLVTAGMDIPRMDELGHAFQVLDEQINQCKNSIILAFAPLAEELLPPITEAIKEATLYFREHREGLEELVVTVAKAIAIYKALSIAKTVILGMQGVYSTLLASAQAYLQKIGILNTQEVIQEEAKQVALTKAQSLGIAKRKRLIDNAAYQDEQREYMRIQKMKIAEEEKTRIFAAYCKQRELRALQEAEKIEAVMTAAYAKQNAAAAAAMVQQGKLAAASASSSAIMAAGLGKVNIALTAATIAITLLGTSFMDTGNTADGVTNQMETGIFSAKTAVEALTVAVLGLQAGWVGAAAALAAYLGYKAIQGNYEAIKQDQANTYTYDGQQYTRQNGQWMKKTLDKNSDDTNNMYDYAVVGDKDIIDSLNELEDIRYKESDEYKKQTQATNNVDKSIDKMNEDMKKMLQDVLNADYGKQSAAGAGAGSAKEPRSYEVKLPIGEYVSELANSFEDGLQWMGEGINFVTDNARIQCDSFTAALYRASGALDDIPDNTVVNDEYFKSKGAYHSAASGYTPHKGDLVVWEDHVGIYMGDGFVRSRQSSAGVTTVSMQEAESYWGPVDGYGSIAEASGNKTVTKTVDEATKNFMDAQKKVYDAQEKMNELARSIFNETQAEGLGKYEQKLIALEDNVLKKQLKINEAKAEGANVEKVQQMLNLYSEMQRKRILDEQRKELDKVNKETEIKLSELTRNYAQAAALRLELAKTEAEQEAEERKKSLAHFMSVDEAEVIANREKYAKMLKAEQDYQDEVREGRQKLLQDIIKDGNLPAVQEYFSDRVNLQNFVSDKDLKARQGLIQNYITWMDEANLRETEILSNLSTTAHDALASNLADFLTGTKTAAEAFEDFGKSVLNMMAQMIAKAIAAKMMIGLFGGLFGGSSSPSSSGSYNIMQGGGFFNLQPWHFASGGIVSSPTLSLIGEGKSNEAVIPLTQSNLAAIGAGIKAVGGGTPNVQVNIQNNSNSEVKVQNTRYDNQLKQMVLDIVVTGAERNQGGFRNNLRAALG